MMPRCFVLLGGQGTRLFPLTSFVHKSMIPICGKPMLEFVIRILKRHEISDIVFCVSNSSAQKQLSYYFGDGSKFDVKITYSSGSKSLNTAGRILNAKDMIDSTFLVYYGDILTNLNFEEVYKFHIEKGGIGTILLDSKLTVPSGTATLDGENRVLDVKEKPSLDIPTNVGVYFLEPEILKYTKKDYDFFGDVFPYAIRSGEKIYGHVSDSYWLDIGTFENLRKAESFVEKNFLRNKQFKF